MSRRRPQPSAKGLRLVNRFALRVDDYAFIGSAHPADHKSIEGGYERARNELLAYIEELEARPATVKSFLGTKDLLSKGD